MAGKHVEIVVAVKHRSTRAYRNRGNQTVHQFTNGFSAVSAQTVERCGLFIVRRLRRNSHCPSQKAPKIAQVSLVPRTGKHLHANRITDSKLFAQQLANMITCR